MHRQITHSNYTVLLAIVVIGILSLIKFPGGNTSFVDNTSIIDSLEKTTPANASLSFAEYQFKVDSLFSLSYCEKDKLTNRGSGLYAGFAGYTIINEPDNCMEGWPSAPPVITDKHYFSLSGYKLKPSATFSTRDGRFFVKTKTVGSNAGMPVMGEQQKEIPVRYVASATGTEKGLLLIPVSTGQFKTIKVLTWISVALLAITGIVILIILPFRILFSITRGKAFTPANTRHLNIIGWGLIGLAIVPNLIALLFSLFFSTEIPGEIYLPIAETLLNNSGVLITGLAVLLIASAFKKGYLVQKENDLTY